MLVPALALGTGYPEPGGLSHCQLRDAVSAIAGRCRLVGFDVTEVNPVYDFSGTTARVAARLLAGDAVRGPA